MKGIKDIFKHSDKISLAHSEREGIKRTLLAHIDMSPVRVGLWGRLKYQRSQTQTKFKLMPLVLALLLTFSGGTALAANSSLPGDFLYPVKVGMNEQIRGALAFTGEAKAGYQGDLAMKRIEEIEQLVAEGDIEVVLKEKIEERFEKHSEKTLSLIEELEAKGNFEAAAAVGARFEASLEAHNELIARISDDSDAIKARIESTLQRLRARLDVATKARVEAEARLESGGSEARARVGATIEANEEQSERAIVSAKDNFTKYESKLSDLAKTAVQSKITSAEEMHASGIANLEAGNLVDAFVDFQNAFSLTHQANVMMKSWMSFDARLHSNDRPWDRDGSDDSRDEDEDRDDDDDEDGQDDNDQSRRDDDEDDKDDNDDDGVDVEIEGDVDLDINGVGGQANGRIDID
ncbi:MAG: DUF5667 domain-containing protein [Candidatus Colwellbacteria bacterium]|nr:DUF5667 domain-containing protein [Candidatus Colwellbacteria bacterium]